MFDGLKGRKVQEGTKHDVTTDCPSVYVLYLHDKTGLLLLFFFFFLLTRILFNLLLLVATPHVAVSTVEAEGSTPSLRKERDDGRRCGVENTPYPTNVPVIG